MVFGLAACGSTSNSSSSSSSKKVTIGVVGSEKFNKTLKEEAKKQGIDIEYKEFSAYTEPNPALDAGDIDMNRFQHIRSEERRVGKECSRLCRSRWSPYH